MQSEFWRQAARAAPKEESQDEYSIFMQMSVDVECWSNASIRVFAMIGKHSRISLHEDGMLRLLSPQFT